MSQFDLKKFLVENKLTTNSRRMVNERAFAPEYDQYGDGPDPLDKFLDAAADSSVFNQRMINDIQALLDRAHSNGKLDLSANPEQEIVRVLVDVWESGRLPHTISDYINPKVLIRDYGFTQQELDDDRAEYLDLKDYKPLDEGETYDYPIDRHDRDYTAEDIAHLARKYGLSMQEMYELVQDYGVDGVISNYEDDYEDDLNTQDHQPLDEFFFYDEKDVQRTDGPMDDQERLQRFLKQIQTSFSGLADYLGLSTQELYQMLEEEGLDAVMDYYDTAQDKNADFIPESFQKKRR